MNKKLETFNRLMATGKAVFVQLDGRRPGNKLPASCKLKPQLVLQYQEVMNPPCFDLWAGSLGISATLVFNGVSEYTLVRWESVFAIMLDDRATGEFYHDACPPEVVATLVKTARAGVTAASQPTRLATVTDIRDYRRLKALRVT